MALLFFSGAEGHLPGNGVFVGGNAYAHSLCKVWAFYLVCRCFGQVQDPSEVYVNTCIPTG